MNSIEEDNKIIVGVLSGDIEAYSNLVRKYNRDVVRVVSSMLFSTHEMEDLVQKVFVDAYEKLDRFEAGRDFGKWIKGIARNTVRMHLRSNKTVEKHKSLYRDWSLSQLEGDENFEIIDQKAKALETCFQEVSENNKAIVEMKYRKLWTLDKIAEKLGRSLEAVTKALSRTRAELRTCIRRRITESE